NLGANSEHVTLPQVQRRSAIIQSSLVRDRDADTLNEAPRGRVPIASNADNVSSRICRIVRLKDRTCKNGTDSALILNILNQQWATGVIRDAKRINFRRLRQSPCGNIRIVRRVTNSAKRRQVVIVRTG